MRWRGLFILALGVVGLVALANAVRHTLVTEPLLNGTHVELEQSFTLTENVQHDLVVLAENITLPADSQVEGDVALIGKHVIVDAAISGDLTVMADQTVIGPAAHIGGNTVLLVDTARIGGHIDGILNLRGNTLTFDPQAALGGTVYACAGTLIDHREDAVHPRLCDESNLMSSTHTLEALHDPNVVLPLVNITISGAAVMILFSALGSLALSGISILGVVVFPRHISHIEEALRGSPRHLGATGLLILLLAGGLTFALAFAVVAVPVLGLVLVPVYIILALLFFGMVLAGWITVALIAGDLILRRITVVMLPPLVIAAVGNIALLLVWNLLALNPISRMVGLMGVLALGAVGLGAACTTRMGTRPMHRSYLVQG